jgi:hypothetical protein
MSNRTMADVVAALRTNVWTEIAVKPRSRPPGDEAPDWAELRDAPMTIDTAKRAMEAGLIFKALRYYDGEIRVVVLPRKESMPPAKVLKSSGRAAKIGELLDVLNAASSTNKR